MTNIFVYGDDCLTDTTIISGNNGITMKLSIDDNSGAYDVYCEREDRCIIDCQSQTACTNMNLWCFGLCYVICGNSTEINSDCPIVLNGTIIRGDTFSPTVMPSYNPTVYPTNNPTIPTNVPSFDPTTIPTINPTILPSHYPSEPSQNPTNNPTIVPTTQPTNNPSIDPTNVPSYNPTIIPSDDPTYSPTSDPTMFPTLTDVKGMYLDLHAATQTKCELLLLYVFCFVLFLQQNWTKLAKI